MYFMNKFKESYKKSNLSIVSQSQLFPIQIELSISFHYHSYHKI